MAVSTICRLNMSPPPSPCSTSDSFPASTTTEVACPARNIRSWKSQCVLGLTCMILGQESSNLVMVEKAMARGMQSDIGAKIIGAQRWSDKRTCEPWRVNSLETIVPENLPRPSARWQWKGIGSLEAAPPVKVVPRTTAKSCFYL